MYLPFASYYMMPNSYTSAIVAHFQMYTVCLLLLPHITTMLLCNIDKCVWLQCVLYYIAVE